MPTLAVRKVDHGFTEYRVTADAARSKTWWTIGSIVVCVVLWLGHFSFFLRATSFSAGLICASCWAFSTKYESVTLIEGLVLQLHSEMRCGVCSTRCYDLEEIQDAIICEHVTTTNVYYYLAFKLIGQQNMAVAYRSLLPRLAVIQPVYQHLLPHLLPAAVTDDPRPANVSKA